MLSFLPTVILVTLLASWGCQVLTHIIRALRPCEVRDKPVARNVLLKENEVDAKSFSRLVDTQWEGKGMGMGVQGRGLSAPPSDPVSMGIPFN